jgi:hypothetical protein
MAAIGNLWDELDRHLIHEPRTTPGGRDMPRDSPDLKDIASTFSFPMPHRNPTAP